MEALVLLLWSCLGSNLLIPAVSANQGPVVQTKYGALRGEYLKAIGKDTVIHSYLGVPFAKPPLGPLRLAAPQPAESWQGVRDATKQPPICVQNRQILVDLSKNLSMIMEIPEMSEDCLYLNIYTPSKPKDDAKLPVMVWIHGGGFAIGSASVTDGTVLAAYQNVVVVAIQYRLGLLGFFSTGDEHAPGNYGLLDQVAALQWVQENIHSFGGDPNTVTIFGESAGGVSVSYLVLSPLTAGLFSYAIAESGTALIDVLFSSNPLPLAQAVTNASGCDISTTKKMVECVMQFTDEDLLRITQGDEVFAFVLTIDGHFLPKSAKELLQNKEFHKVPLITGVNDDECGFEFLNFLAGSGWIDGIDRVKYKAFTQFFFQNLKDNRLFDLVTNEYIGTTDDPIKIRDGLREVFGDLMFNIPNRELATYHKASGATVYVYEFKHSFNELKKKRPDFVGSDHADELFFVFGICFMNSHIKTTGTFTEQENELCRTTMAYWGNFARTGSPNGPGLTSWPEFGSEAEYLAIGLKQKAEQDIKGKHYSFMTKTLPEIKQQIKEEPVVQTKYGTLKGKYDITKGKNTIIHSYLGVPFAKPPLGPLRFAAPQPAEPWRGVKDATKQPYMCVQNKDKTEELLKILSFEMEVPDVSEDCLYLNVYTPTKPGEKTNLPVMVWIHGGGLSLGSASMYDGSALSAYQNVVVVVIQYRLGLLGFFSTGDDNAPGNYGFLDQVAALQWVQENIQSFGGDPHSVTIFGESAGGASVSFLLLSPLATGLFHRVIAESGTALMFGIVADPLPVAQHVANASGCDMSSTKKIAECLKQWSMEDMKTFLNNVQMLHFVATVDKNFLPEPVDDLLQKQKFQKVPLLIGVNNDEFGWLLANGLLPPGWADGMEREQILNSMAAWNPDPQIQRINELLTDEYLGSSADPIQIRDSYKEMMADLVFNIPALKLAKLHQAAGAPVYFYQLQHPPSIVQGNRPSFVGADHGDDVAFVFGMCFLNGDIKASAPFTEEDKDLCRTVMAYWGNFARTGSPNGPGLIHWPEYGTEREYLAIGLKQKAAKNLNTERYHFMTETLPELIREKTGHSEL